MLTGIEDRLEELKASVRRDNAWLRFFVEYDSPEKLVDLLMRDRPLTKHDRRLLQAIPTLMKDGLTSTNVEVRNIVLIRKVIVKYLENRLKDMGIDSNSPKLDHLSIGMNTEISILNRWHKVITNGSISISMTATIDVPKKYYLPGFQENEIILPSRYGNITVDAKLPYATVIVKVNGIADLSKNYIYFNGRSISDKEAYAEFLESYQDMPWYRKFGVLAPTPFEKWIKAQKTAKATYRIPTELVETGMTSERMLRSEANNFAKQVSSEFSSLWTGILDHPLVHFRKPLMKLKKR